MGTPHSPDPRVKNKLPQGETVATFLADYAGLLSAALARVPATALEAAFSTLAAALKSGRRVYSAGNGGSAAIADHLCCDWLKGTALAGQPSLKVHGLTSSTALFTAIANDFGYEQSISWQIEQLGERGDVLVLISSSGNSPNIVRAARSARARGVVVIGLTGFSGGELSREADVSLHVPAENYGIVEDAHQMIMHALAQYLARARDEARLP